MKLSPARAQVVLALLAALGSSSCGPATSGIKPVGASDPESACPGGRQVWNLQITDLRAERGDGDRVRGLIRQSLSRYFPGCQWTDRETPDVPTIAIEIHRFTVDFDGSMYDAAAEWSVAARSASGQTLTEFEANASVPRPNYRGSNNEREALQAAMEQALQRTAAGLRHLTPVP
jgi:hypothetical protein